MMLAPSGVCRFACLVTAMLCVAMTAPAALAAVIPVDISADGSITYDTVNSQSTSPGSHSGSMSATEGGTATNSGFADGSATGTNPLTATFTDTGDGFGISASGETGDSGYILAGVDLTIDLGNSSLTTSYKIVFRIDYSHAADADGTDSYLYSEFIVDRPPGTQVSYTDATSDTVFGDFKNGSSTGTDGAAITSSGTKYVSVLLGPGGSTSLEGYWTMEGEDFAGSTATGSATISITIDRVTPVPEPATFVLFGAGLLGVAGLRRWRNRK